MLSFVRLFGTPWNVARRTALSMGILQTRILEWGAVFFSRDLPNPGIELRSSASQVDSFLSEPPGNDYLSVNLLTIKLTMVCKSTKHKCLIKHHKVDVIMSDRTLDFI